MKTREGRALSPARPTDYTVNQPEGTTADNAQATDSGPARHPAVYASAYSPSGRRSRWLVITGACPWCDGRHAHFAASLADAAGTRTAGCGRTYWVVIARRYTHRQVTR